MLLVCLEDNWTCMYALLFSKFSFSLWLLFAFVTNQSVLSVFIIVIRIGVLTTHLAVCLAQRIVSYRKVVASSEMDNKIKLSIKFHLTLSLSN